LGAAPCTEFCDAHFLGISEQQKEKNARKLVNKQACFFWLFLFSVEEWET
jgi:hypothetical protein